MIKRFLSRFELYDNEHADVFNYILLLYLVVEQIEVVFDIIKLPEQYITKNFNSFQQIRKWANFIKHPKAFVFTHHAKYDFDENSEWYEKNNYIKINHQFVQDYYSGIHDKDKQRIKNEKLFKILSNAEYVVVLFPNIDKLTDDFCYCFKKFVNVIANNEIYQEVLDDKTTLEKYFLEN